MPNDCLNVYTVIGDVEDIQEIFRSKLEKLSTLKGSHGGNIVHIEKRTDRGIRFQYWSPNVPNKDWMLKVIEMYPLVWMKNCWSEEGGGAGVIVGGTLYGKRYEIREMAWEDVVLEDDFHEFKF